MLPFFRSLFDTDFMPHIYCLRGEPDVLWLHVVSDLLTVVSFFAIPVALVRLMFLRKDRSYRIVAGLFALFIGTCGLTHLLEIWTLWVPMYRLQGVVKAVLALLAVTTTLVMMRMLAYLSRVPSAAELELEIRKRDEAMERSREKDERFRALLNSAPDAMVISGPDGLIELTNKEAERLFGYESGEMVGHPVTMLIPEDLRGGYRADSEQFLRHGLRDDMTRNMGSGLDLRARRKDGSEVPVEISFSPLEGPTGVSITAAIRDMTERKRIETRFRMLLESAPDAMVIVNCEGAIVLSNAQTEKIFGYSQAELTGQPVEILMAAGLHEGHRAHREGFAAIPRRREMGAGLELLAQRRDGSQFPVEISLSPLEGTDGMSVTAAIRDVTERVAAARQLAEKVTELRQSNEALEQFAHIASHDLQEPLRMVASYVQLISRRYKGKLDADADEFIGFAVDGTQRMKRLIEDLLVYSRAGRGEMSTRPVNSWETLQEALYNLRGSIEESKAEVTYDALPMILTSELQLVQLFQNLVGNAIKYRGERAPRIHVSARKQEAGAGEEWVFSVADNGIGIEPQYFERVFVIFQRLHGLGEYEGTGIGLAICKRVLQQQGGRIWVESEPGQGSVFHFALPVR